MRERSFHRRLLTGIAPKGEIHHFRQFVPSQRTLVPQILCERHVVALHIHPPILLREGVHASILFLVFVFRAKSCLLCQLLEVIPRRTSVFVYWGACDIHLRFFHAFAAAILVGHAIEGVLTLREAEHLLRFSDAFVANVESFISDVHFRWIGEAEQSCRVVAKHPPRSAEHHGPQSLLVALNRGHLFGDKHALVALSFQVNNHIFSSIHEV